MRSLHLPQRHSVHRARRPHQGFRLAVGMAVGALALSVLAACGSDDDDTSSSGNDAPLYEALPQSVKDKGVVTIAGISESPPNVTHDDDGKTLIGISPDVMKALSKVLGVKVVYEPVQEFGSILTGVQAGRFDGGYLFADTLERQKVADMLSFLDTGTVFIAGPGVADAGDDFPCGSKVGVSQGSVNDYAVTRLSESECQGKAAVDIKRFANGAAGFTALSSGQIDYYSADPMAGTYSANQSGGKFTAATKTWDPVPAGFAMSKEKADLTEVLSKGLQQLLDDGTIKSILEDWDTTTEVIRTTVGLNEATK